MMKTSPTFSERIEHVPTSFLREVFKVIADERIISFGGGLPNPHLFPTDALLRAAQTALQENPQAALQYGTTEGLPELRSAIAQSYRRKDGAKIDPEHILITSGSQQGLDLLGKALINEGDTLAVENPTYLAALQAFSMYRPSVLPLPLTEHGVAVDVLTKVITRQPPKLLYTIPNFHNPTGITYDEDTRSRVANSIDPSQTLLIEDDPYGEIRFEGERGTSFFNLVPNAVLLGSFSKIVAPGMRLGWIVVRDEALRARLYTAKQASDLHSSTLIQHIVHCYYRDNDTDAHVHTIASAYKEQRDAMIEALKKHLGDRATYTVPKGGMFIWVTLSPEIDTMRLFPKAIDEGVAFVPGETFFTGPAQKNTMRINYTNATREEISEGVRRLLRAIEQYEAEA